MNPAKWCALALSLALPWTPAQAQTSETGAPGQTAAAGVASLSAGAAEVLKLASAGTSEEIILAYVQSAQMRFGLSADNILYLKDLGVSSAVITAMLNRDSVLRAQQPAPVAPALAPESAPVVAAAAPAVTSPAPGPAPVYVTGAPADVTYFYDDLSPYGTWVQLEGYGWCWQPTVVVASPAWRPYCDGGHWTYTDAGWFWESDYSWGWAPFHYGRWSLHPRCGWVWVPDRVWGPAWVTWRIADDHCGWAPLPPHADLDVRLGLRFNGVRVSADFDFGLGIDLFTFVAVGDFNRHDLGHRRLPPAEVHNFYHRTTVINNYYVHDAIVNRGIPAERVSAVTHTPIRKVEIRDLPAGSPRDMKGGQRAVYRPQLRPPSRPVEMHAQQIDERHPVIQHAPAEMRRPSTPAPRVEPPRALESKPAGRFETPPAAPARREQSSAPNPPSPSGPAAHFPSAAPARNPAPAAPAEAAPKHLAQPGVPAGSTPGAAMASPGGSRTPAAPKAQYTPKTHQQAAEIHSLPADSSKDPNRRGGN